MDLCEARRLDRPKRLAFGRNPLTLRPLPCTIRRACGSEDAPTQIAEPRLPGWTGHIHFVQDASANRVRQHGHSPSYPLRSAANADGCGIVMMALNASGAVCA